MRISVEELSRREADKYMVLDVRDEDAFECGHIPGAVNVPAERLATADGGADGGATAAILPRDKEIFVCCAKGLISEDIAEELCAQGYAAYSIEGGYAEWLRLHIGDMLSDTAEQVEAGLRRGAFARKLFGKFGKAIATYELVQPGDKIAVCISGGKDSMLMAKLFQELKRRNKFPFELVFLVMDPGYSKENREIIERNARVLNIPITIFESNIFENVYNIDKSPCYVCARMRRGYLYSKAQELGCNKIALGHHYDDVIETTLMGMLFGGQMQTMMPKLRSQNFEGMQLIRPMYLIREDDIKAWRDFYHLGFIQCACRFTDTCTSEACKTSNTGSKRRQTKELIRALKKTNPQVEQNIFSSAENVHLATILAYKDRQGVKHTFLDEY